jgi:uncharacterized protein (TIGR00251 family)
MRAASTVIRLRVAPGGARSRVVGRHGDAWKLSVTALPEDGKANDAVVSLLASTLNISPSSVTLVAGHTGRSKTVRLAGIEAGEVEELLAAAVSPLRKPS